MKKPTTHPYGPSLLAALAITLLLALPSGAFGQQRIMMRGGPEPTVNAEQRAKIVDQVCQALSDIYVFPDKAEQMCARLQEKLSAGKYDKLTKISTFTNKLTADLHAVCRDLHLRVMPAPPPPEKTQGEEPSVEERQQNRLERARYTNFGFEKIERLPGNIGYLDLREFCDAADAGATAVAAMNFLAHSDALIIDLRQNGGGSPSMIQLLSSYFFEQPVHLNSFYIRQSDTTRQFWTQAQVRGPRLVDQPIYVLTSNRTFSAAEEFTYNLKNLERATIIGETTGGGAHPVNFLDFPELNIALSMPFGRAINPITNTNWEGTGIAPHMAVPAPEALDVARIEAMKELAKNETDEGKKFRLDWAMTSLEANQNPVLLSEKELAAFAGTYGPRKIFLKEGSLCYQRDGGTPYPLIPSGKDLFLLKGLDSFRIQFSRNDQQEVDELIGLYDMGRRDSNARTGS